MTNVKDDLSVLGDVTSQDTLRVTDAAASGASLEIGWSTGASIDSYGIRRSDTSGVFSLMANANNPQILLGNEINTTGSGFIDVDNNRPLNLNTLDTGAGTPAPVNVGTGGLNVSGNITVTGNVDGVDVGSPKRSIVIDTNQYMLSGDVATPGNNFIYGTSATGVKGWRAISSIDHNTLTNYVGNRHIDHSVVSIVAGTGLTGGGTITTSRTLNVVGVNSIVANADNIQLVNDVSAPGNLYFYSTNSSGAKGWFEATEIFSNDFTFKRTFFGLDGFVDVSGAGGDWPVNKTATDGFDSIATSVPVRKFDDNKSQGTGLFVRIPNAAQNIEFQITHRAQSAPATSADIKLVLYSRTLLDNAALPAFVGPTDVATITIPNNAFWQYDTVGFPIGTLGIVAGDFVQIEFVRDTSDPNDTLNGDWVLAQITILIT